VSGLLELLVSFPVLVGFALAFAVVVWLARQATH
jgi:hypothetical protein